MRKQLVHGGQKRRLVLHRIAIIRRIGGIQREKGHQVDLIFGIAQPRGEVSEFQQVFVKRVPAVERIDRLPVAIVERVSS